MPDKRVASLKSSKRVIVTADPPKETPKRDPEVLTALSLMCQSSGKPFDYDVPHDAGTLKDLWDRRLMVTCPHCREVHGFLFRTAYVDSMLRSTRLPLAGL